MQGGAARYADPFEFKVGEAPTGCRSHKTTNQHPCFTPVRQYNTDGLHNYL
jgi:hypothetical protein